MAYSDYIKPFSTKNVDTLLNESIEEHKITLKENTDQEELYPEEYFHNMPDVSNLEDEVGREDSIKKIEKAVEVVFSNTIFGKTPAARKRISDWILDDNTGYNQHSSSISRHNLFKNIIDLNKLSRSIPLSHKVLLAKLDAKFLSLLQSPEFLRIVNRNPADATTTATNNRSKLDLLQKEIDELLNQLLSRKVTNEQEYKKILATVEKKSDQLFKLRLLGPNN